VRKYEITIDAKVFEVTVNSFSQESAELEINGHSYELEFKGPMKTVMDGNITAQAATKRPTLPDIKSVQSTPLATPPVQPAQPQAESTVTAAGQSAILAPIPGSIISILVEVGDQIEAGQLVMKMEAMKMENEINATKSGKVSSIDVSIGDAVSQGDKLITID